MPDFWEGQVENRAYCGKIVIFSGLKEGIFQFVPDTSEPSILHLFLPNSPISNLKKHQKSLKNLYFWTNFKQFSHFLPSPYFGAKFQIL